MPIANKEVRQKLYDEYKELDKQYRKLIDKLSPLVLTLENYDEHEQLLQIGRQLDMKKQELDEAYGIRRIPSP